MTTNAVWLCKVCMLLIHRPSLRYPTNASLPFFFNLKRAWN